MKNLFLFLFLFSISFTHAQNKNVDKILKEGILLYRLEMGSWYGTDDMISRFETKKDSIGGYLSYETPENKINTIFFSRYDADKILIRYEFDSVPKPEPIKIDTLSQNATELEKSLIAIRQDAKTRVIENKDKFFSFYEKTSLNFIPIISDEESSVFIITASNAAKIVVIGNDYKLSYDKKNNFKKKEKLHNSILQFPYASELNAEPSVSYHSHVVTEYITSTDICTLLLYKNHLNCSQHIVMGKKEVSIFNLEEATLFVLTKKAWNKIYNHQANKD